jgi:hypothetical protein
LLTGEGREGMGEEQKHSTGEKAWSSINHSIFFGVGEGIDKDNIQVEGRDYILIFHIKNTVDRLCLFGLSGSSISQ